MQVNEREKEVKEVVKQRLKRGFMMEKTKKREREKEGRVLKRARVF